ncbi:hypothetical protein M433DRAFT_262863 [Acidomyces richmondensis BFW]|nr:MAG: hypothetical protein FE78DRAFT_411444 [Acidomyces sp. 'richmondensis']KYG45292.1 hypothetical protein M433DRAFT_262863 [Acidomyces richmondensis BFW]
MGQERLPARSSEKCPSMEMPGSACMARYGNVDPFIIQPMLGVYSSDEIIRESETVPRTLNVKRRDSIPILNPVYQRAVPLRGTKIISNAIDGSKRRASGFPSLSRPPEVLRMPTGQLITEKSGVRNTMIVPHPTKRCESEASATIGTQKPQVLSSSATRPSGTYAEAIANKDCPKYSLSASAGALRASISESISFGNTTPEIIHPKMQIRSVEFGESHTRTPFGPLPPLPLSLHSKKSRDHNSQRQGFSIYRLSSSSQDIFSASGSPAERRSRTLKSQTDRLENLATVSTLQSMSQNRISCYNMPSPQPSACSQVSSFSGRISNGNPFQWRSQFTSLTQNSAWKRSLNAVASKERKSRHCVRTCATAPQILEPTPSRSTSPNIIHDIEEREGKLDIPMEEEGPLRNHVVKTDMKFASPHNTDDGRASKSTSLSSVAQNLRVQMPRTSLRHTSPTFSTRTAENKWQGSNGLMLSREPSETHLLFSETTSPVVRTTSWKNGSSLSSDTLLISSFPASIKSAIKNVQIEGIKLPQFYKSQSSNNEIERIISSQLELHMCASEKHTELPSSPPVLISKSAECDSIHPLLAGRKAWRAKNNSASQTKSEGPVESNSARLEQIISFDAERLFACYSYAVSCDTTCDVELNGKHNALLSCPSASRRPLSTEKLSCSPKPMSCATFEDEDISELRPVLPVSSQSEKHLQPQRRAQKLNRANASTILATLYERPKVGFPNTGPVLLPPIGSIELADVDSLQPRPQNISRNIIELYPLPTAPSTPISDKSGVQYSPNLPGQVWTSTRRFSLSKTGKNVLEKAAALRRIESEIGGPSRKIQRRNQIERGANSLLPCMKSQDPSKSYFDLFNLCSCRLSPDTLANALEDDSIMVAGGLVETDFEERKKRFERASGRFDAESPCVASWRSQRAERAIKGVWGDEKFLEKMRDFKDTPCTPIGEPITPTKKVVPQNCSKLQTPVGKLQLPVRNRSVPSSNAGTPQSLYDSDGFLRS